MARAYWTEDGGKTVIEFDASEIRFRAGDGFEAVAQKAASGPAEASAPPAREIPGRAVARSRRLIGGVWTELRRY